MDASLASSIRVVITHREPAAALMADVCGPHALKAPDFEPVGATAGCTPVAERAQAMSRCIPAGAGKPVADSPVDYSGKLKPIETRGERPCPS